MLLFSLHAEVEIFTPAVDIVSPTEVTHLGVGGHLRLVTHPVRRVARHGGGGEGGKGHIMDDARAVLVEALAMVEARAVTLAHRELVSTVTTEAFGGRDGLDRDVGHWLSLMVLR